MRIDKAKIRDTLVSEDKKETKQRASVYTESYKGEYYNLSIEKLIPFKNQARKTFTQKNLEELASTIKIHGIRQPLTVLASKNIKGLYEIISGERRWRAAKLVELKKVPCIILHDQDSAEEIALIENIQREDLHPIELMEGLKTLLKKGICSNHREIAEKIGITRTSVVEIIALDKLPLLAKEAILRNKIKSRYLFRELLKTNESEHESILKQFSEQQPKKDQKTKKASTKCKLITVYFEDDKFAFDDFAKKRLSSSEKDLLKRTFIEFVDKT